MAHFLLWLTSRHQQQQSQQQQQQQLLATDDDHFDVDLPATVLYVQVGRDGPGWDGPAAQLTTAVLCTVRIVATLARATSRCPLYNLGLGSRLILLAGQCCCCCMPNANACALTRNLIRFFLLFISFLSLPLPSFIFLSRILAPQNPANGFGGAMLALAPPASKDDIFAATIHTRSRGSIGTTEMRLSPGFGRKCI